MVGKAVDGGGGGGGVKEGGSVAVAVGSDPDSSSDVLVKGVCVIVEGGAHAISLPLG